MGFKIALICDSAHSIRKVPKIIQHFSLLYIPLKKTAIGCWAVPNAVDKVVYTPEDGWWYHPKHAEKLPEKINCVKLHLFGYMLE
jgi:hypothetical protein